MALRKPVKRIGRKIEKKPHIPRTAIQELVGHGKPTKENVNQIIRSIQKMVIEAKTTSDVRDGYKMTPEQMVKAGKIKVIYRDSGPHFGMTPKYGCYQMSSVLYTAMKEMGLSPKMTRFFTGGTPHTTVLFRLEGKLYEADPFESMLAAPPGEKNAVHLENPYFTKVDDYRRKEISELMKINRFKFIKPGQYTKQMYDKERKTGRLAV